jgi:hypothetical protein
VWFRRDCAEGREWVERFLARCPDATRARACALLAVGELNGMGDTTRARGALAEAVEDLSGPTRTAVQVWPAGAPSPGASIASIGLPAPTLAFCLAIKQRRSAEPGLRYWRDTTTPHTTGTPSSETPQLGFLQSATLPVDVAVCGARHFADSRQELGD